LEYKQIRFFKTKLAALFIVGVCFCSILFLGANVLFGDPLGIGYNRVSSIISENRMLKEQVLHLGNQADEIQKSLHRLADRGNELRMMVDLKSLDEETRKAPVGGSVTADGVVLSGNETSKLITQTNELLDQLQHEVRLQQTSHEEIYRRYQYNAGLFSHLPAIKPMSGYYSVNGFGMRVHPVLRVYRMHEGVDIINDVGTDVFAAGDGVIRYAGRTQGGYGTVVDVAHGYGYSSLYAHLSKILVRPGQKVKRGEVIGKSGRTGLVSGPHLHYEVRFNGRKQNPVDYFFDDIHASRYRTQVAGLRGSEN